MPAAPHTRIGVDSWRQIDEINIAFQAAVIAVRIARVERAAAPDAGTLRQVARRHRNHAVRKTKRLEYSKRRVVGRSVAGTKANGCAPHCTGKTVARFADNFVLLFGTEYS